MAVQCVLHELGYTEGNFGVRLDSGDLAFLADESKKLFKEAGDKFGFDFSNLKVFASNDINEEVIKKLNEKNHKIDVFGIGTNLVTC